MATRNKRKLAALNKENCEKHPTSNLAQNSNVSRSQEDYITQVSQEIERRVAKRLSKEFSRTANRILGALARLDAFFMNLLLRDHSGTTPEMSRNAFSTNQETNEDDSLSDCHPEAGIFGNQTMQNSGPEDDHYIHFTPALVRPITLERTVSFCFDETAPTLTISKSEFFHNFNAVFKLSLILVSNLSRTEVLPVYSSINNCWLKYRFSEQVFFGDLNNISN